MRLPISRSKEVAALPTTYKRTKMKAIIRKKTEIKKKAKSLKSSECNKRSELIFKFSAPTERRENPWRDFGLAVRQTREATRVLT